MGGETTFGLSLCSRFAMIWRFITVVRKREGKSFSWFVCSLSWVFSLFSAFVNTKYGLILFVSLPHATKALLCHATKGTANARTPTRVVTRFFLLLFPGPIILSRDVTHSIFSSPPPLFNGDQWNAIFSLPRAVAVLFFCP